LETGDWLVPEDFIDGTRGEYYTYHDKKAGGYIQQVPPFDPASRAALIEALGSPPPNPLLVNGEGEVVSGRSFRRGVYVCVSNSRFETPAEGRFWARAGGHVVGRFLSPCLILARELEMQVAVLAFINRSGGEVGESLAFEAYRPVLQDALMYMMAG
jgi:5'-methylthioadenosine phosphorylase